MSIKYGVQCSPGKIFCKQHSVRSRSFLILMYQGYENDFAVLLFDVIQVMFVMHNRQSVIC